ncbi:MAG: efflux RND transporter periplasmic adaptor subunit [Tepidimonas taiwanensis]|nr:efflux RND transporter periplasmic adaptor subunit [Tepidimonas taiwanensis]
MNTVRTLACAVLLACAGPGTLWANAPAGAGTAPATAGNANAAVPASSAQAAAVGVQPLADVAVHPLRSASAQVVPRNEARIAAEVGGVLLRWEADVGTAVRAGQMLARLDDTDLALAAERARAALQAAQARLALAEAQTRRARELQAQGFFSPEALAARETELALQRADVAQATAALRTAERQLAKAVVRAPFAGVVTQRLAQQGETVAAGTPLFVLAQTDGAELQAAVSPAEAQELRRARALRFETDAGEQRPARLLRVVPTVSGATRLQTVRLALQGEPVPAGSAGLLRWEAPDPHVPAALLVRRGAALGVFVAEGDGAALRARFVPLPLAQEGRPAAVTLSPTTRLVTRGQQALRDGQAIAVAP